MIAAYLPLVLLVLILLFYKKCLRFEARYEDREVIIPRIVVWSTILLSLIPFVGYLMCLVIGAAYPLSCDVELRDNKFTRFWLKK